MREDVLEQIVDDYLQLQGYFHEAQRTGSDAELAKELQGS